MSIFQITKARLPIYVKESVEEKVLKKRKYREEKYPEEENNAEGGKISEKEKNAKIFWFFLLLNGNFKAKFCH